MNINQTVLKQKTYFSTAKTIDVSFRIEALKKLKSALKQNEKDILQALQNDLGKSFFEGYMTEVGMIYDELNFMLKNIKKLSKIKKVKTPISQFSAKSYILPSPYGNVLIMSPWNYPFLLTIDPLIDAISAGNTAVIKPSNYSPDTSAIIKKIIAENFDEEYIAVVEGGREQNAELLDCKFDYIFFTGGKTVGKLVMEKASKNLTPVTLELGGKSPCIIDKTANLKLTAKRLVFGKFLNVGQTCVAPDYVLIDKSVKPDFINYVVSEIETQYGKEPLKNENYGKIINKKHFDRILGLIAKDKIVCGGTFDESLNKISPTVMDNISFESKVMQEEIFGPILPILTFDDISQVKEMVDKNPTPLALYLFSNDKNNIEKITTEISFGGGCINDVIIHLATSDMPFGGVGQSGMGAYHGKYGFDTFTHYKSIVNKKNWIDLNIRYQPYTKEKQKMVEKFMK